MQFFLYNNIGFSLSELSYKVYLKLIRLQNRTILRGWLQLERKIYRRVGLPLTTGNPNVFQPRFHFYNIDTANIPFFRQLLRYYYRLLFVNIWHALKQIHG